MSAGKVATAHEIPLAFGSGANIGYILVDPVKGSGTYKIATGENGGNIYIGAWGLATILAMISSMGTLTSVAKYSRLIPLLVSPIGIYFSLALAGAIVILAILNAILGPEASCSERCPEVRFMETLAMLGAFSALLIGGAGPLILFSIMIIYMAHYFTALLV